MDVNVIKTNRMIAFFMGARNLQGMPHEVWLPVHGVNRIDTVDLGKGPILEYHKSWDWLLPVVVKLNDSLRGSKNPNIPITVIPTSVADTYLLVKNVVQHINS
mgnify:CR=1 FL=1